MVNIYIVTVATKPGGYLKWLEESCIRNGTKLIVLGMGSEWKGYVTKPLLVSEFLKTIPDDDIVCVIDAYDVLMVQHIDKLKEKFLEKTKNSNYKMICAKDVEQDAVIKYISEKRFNVKEGNLPICAGTYISYVKFLKEAYDWMLEYSKKNNEKDDQYLLNNYYGIKKDEIYIDNYSKLFKTDGSFIFKHKDTDEFVFLHRIFNTEMISVLIFYGYNNISIEELVELFKSSIISVTTKTLSNFPESINKIFNINNK